MNSQKSSSFISIVHWVSGHLDCCWNLVFMSLRIRLVTACRLMVYRKSIVEKTMTQLNRHQRCSHGTESHSFSSTRAFLLYKQGKVNERDSKPCRVPSQKSVEPMLICSSIIGSTPPGPILSAILGPRRRKE